MNNVPHWPRALDTRFGQPLAGQYRATPEDFIVEERLDFTPEGSGEHLWLWIEKRQQSTLDVVKVLKRLCEVAPKAIGYSGMKDRIAVTRQWLSVHLPGREAPAGLTEALHAQGITLLEHARHPRKLKRGVHRTNHFILRLSGPAIASDDFAARWQTLCQAGVPNYFGPQRFGAEGRNLARAEAVLANGWRKRDDRQGMMLSTARSFLFNELLSARLGDGTWQQVVVGDTLMLDGTQSLFTTHTVEASLQQRAAELDLHPTAPLWGVGESASGAAGDYERLLAERHPVLCRGLEESGVKRAQRALRMRLLAPCCVHEADDVAMLSFALPRGGFATAVIQELLSAPDLV